jgi:hypothetical protein
MADLDLPRPRVYEDLLDKRRYADREPVGPG